MGTKDSRDGPERSNRGNNSRPPSHLLGRCYKSCDDALYWFSSRLGVSKKTPPLGRVLVRERIITDEQLYNALDIQKNDPQRLGQIIVEQGFASEVEVLQAIAKEYRVAANSLSDNIGELIKEQPKDLISRLSAVRMPIRVKLSIAITFIIWGTILFLSFMILARQKDTLYQHTLKTGKISLQYLIKNTAVPLLEDDTVGLYTLIKEAGSVEGLSYAIIVNRKNVVKAHTSPESIGLPLGNMESLKEPTREGDMTYFRRRLASGEHVLNLSRPITFSDKELGAVHVGISLDFIDRQIRKESINITILSLFIVLLGISIAILIGIGFSRPISRLVLATHEIGKGNFNYRIQKVSKDEFGDLATAFNYMSGELWKKLVMQKSFGSYVSPEILGMILAQPEEDWLKGNRMEVTVLFTDIRGFTAYSETAEPEDVVEGVNEYFRIATKHINENGGYVDKFIGDAVLGVFGAPIARLDHAQRALKAAVTMQEEFREGGSQGKPFLDHVGIGIHSGVAIAGDLGSEVKKQYSVIGDCVNLASRLNSVAGPGQIIISRFTRDKALDFITANPLPPVKVKGKAEAIEIFELLGLHQPEGSAKEGNT